MKIAAEEQERKVVRLYRGHQVGGVAGEDAGRSVDLGRIEMAFNLLNKMYFFWLISLLLQKEVEVCCLTTCYM